MASKEAGALQGAASGAAAGTAIMPGWGTAIGGAIGLAGSLMGSDQESAAAAAANDELKKRQALIDAIPIPDVEKMKLKLQLQQSVGQYNPLQEQVQQLQGNYYSGVQADPAMLAQQQQYLKTLQEVAQKGETPAEMAQRNSLMNHLAAQSQSKIQDIQREQAQRGMASSGGSLLAKLVAQQQAQNAGAEQADQLQAQIYNRKLQAGGAAAAQANQLDTQQYNRAVGVGERNQAIDTFNKNMAAQTGMRNVANQNQAQLNNLTSAQNIANNNTGTLNQQQQYNSQLGQTNYNNQLAKYGMGNQFTPSIAKGLQNQGQIQAGRTAAIGGAAGSLADYLGNKLGNSTPDTSYKAEDNPYGEWLTQGGK